VQEESKEAIAKLKGMGIRCMMLAVDKHQVARFRALPVLARGDKSLDTIPSQE
jgi:cation transport ATPase